MIEVVNLSVSEKALKLHKELQGKISVKSKVAVRNKDDLSLAYSPGVAEPCGKIEEDRMAVYDYTNKGEILWEAVVSTGTAVLEPERHWSRRLAGYGG